MLTRKSKGQREWTLAIYIWAAGRTTCNLMKLPLAAKLPSVKGISLDT